MRASPDTVALRFSDNPSISAKASMKCSINAFLALSTAAYLTDHWPDVATAFSSHRFSANFDELED
ncbi:hypothetical protein CR51_12480 [Caballeronia megalochromosomata]|nr:hypothetical protein CR51_12480 [Caballeronia megalochromosomata]